MIKTLMKYIGEYKKPSIIAPITVAIEVVLEVTIIFLMASLIDDGIEMGDMGVIVKIGVALIVMCAFSLTFGILSGRIASKASAGFAKNLRNGMFHNIQNFAFSNIDKFSTSSLVTRMTTDVTNVQNAYMMLIRVCVRAPLMIIFSVFMAFQLSSTLAWVFVGVIPFLAIGLYLVIHNVRSIFDFIFRTYDKLNNMVQENLRGIRVVKSYVREDYEVEKFEGISTEIYTNFVKAEKILAFNTPLMQFSMYASNLLICWFGAQLIVNGSFGTGPLMSLLAYTAQILTSLMLLSMVFVMVTMSQASAKRIAEVLEETSDMKNGTIKEVKDGSIFYQNAGFSYRGEGGKLCLKNISFSVPSGGMLGIIGGTGSGKSSLVQLIPRLYDVTEGSLLVGGENVENYDIEALREEVAMVLQKNILFAGTIKDNLRWGKEDATDEEIEFVCKLAQADEFITSFPEGYDTWIEQGGSNVSGGQRQRLCIARALLKNPKILILDDSTSAVDTKTDSLIRQAFSEQIPDTTKIIVAQRISSIQEADQIIVLDGGEIESIGTHEELLETSSIYREVYESQQKGGLGDDAA